MHFRKRSNQSIVDAIYAEFENAELIVSPEEVKDLRVHGKLLLLLDGVNEIPSQQGHKDLQQFHEHNSHTRMIFTTRDLALGGSFGIEKQLEMCALTQPQMREFVHKHLPQHGDSLLRQLRDSLRKIAETPLLLKMMCEVFENTGEIPQSKGELFQKFDRQYNEFKDDAWFLEDFSLFKSEFLEQLAFVMLQQPTKSLVIRRDRAGIILEGWLRDRGVMDAPIKARKWLKDLLKHHLLQVAAKPEEIEFHHQLFQEYYAGLALQKLFDDKHPDVIEDERLKHFYLNYFKWKEPLAFMLSLLEDKKEAERVVRLALEVDVMLGARLAGEVQRDFQKRTVGLVDGLDVPGWLKVGLLGEVRSDDAIPGLLKFVEDSDSDVRGRVADALGAIGSEVAISELFKLVEDSDSNVRSSVAYAFGEIGSEVAISELLKLVKDSDSDVRCSVAYALGKIGDKAAIPGLLKLIEDSDSDVHWSGAEALCKIGDNSAITGLLKLVEKSNYAMRRIAADALCKIGNKAAISKLLKLLKHSDSDVRCSVAEPLGKIGNKAAIEGLLKLLEDSEYSMRRMATDALGNINNKAAIQGLLKLVEHSDSDVRSSAADALGNIGDKAAIERLLKLIEDSDSDVRWSAANALGNIGDKAAIPGLLKLVEDSDSDVRSSAADALGNIGDKAAIPGLLKLVKDSKSAVRFSVAKALDKIGDNAAIEGLLKLVEDSNSAVREKVAKALGKIGDKAAIEGLLKLVKDSKSAVRFSVAEALGKIGDKAAIEGLLKLVEDSDFYRWIAAEALANIAKQHKEKVAPHLPHLLTLIPSKSGTEVHRLILAIQAACKYYNYPIRQLSLTQQPAKPPQPNELLAKIDETTQQIHKKTKQMADQPTQDFSNSTFHAPVNFAPNYGNQAQNLTIAAQQSSPEAALNAVVQIIQALEKKYTYVKDEEQALNIIDAEFKEIKEQKPIEWQNLISLKRLYNGGKNAAVKVGEHFAESNPWGKGLVAFIEGVSEDVN
ncbi:MULTISPECIES: HEAT repeat domain-containing protein [unclassified Microcoleus]|uniref:HEAT repeat domain-containing protein n=1 Tax=unclassified Microcoleus TaxID=2642155 RepID=UPI0025F84F80|nr:MULTISPECIES: HEAT repeat domain-containing protein [unclassified Microcoleus]